MVWRPRSSWLSRGICAKRCFALFCMTRSVLPRFFLFSARSEGLAIVLLCLYFKSLPKSAAAVGAEKSIKLFCLGSMFTFRFRYGLPGMKWDFLTCQLAFFCDLCSCERIWWIWNFSELCAILWGEACKYNQPAMVCCALRQSLIAATSPTVVGRDASGGNNAFVSATKVNLNPTSYLFILLPRTPPLFPTQPTPGSQKNAWALFFCFSLWLPSLTSLPF